MGKREPKKRACACGCGREFEPSNAKRIYFNSACAQKARYHADPVAQRAVHNRWRVDHLEQVLESQRAYRDRHPGVAAQKMAERRKKFPEKVRAEKRADYHKHKPKRIATNHAYRARLKAQLAEARRIIALGTQNVAHRTNRTKETTDARITLAASLVLDELGKYAMKDQLFPKQHDGKERFNGTKQLFRRYGSRIEEEKARLSSMPLNERALAVQSARRML